MSARSSLVLDWLNGDVAELRQRYDEACRVADKGQSAWDAVATPAGPVRYFVQSPQELANPRHAIVYLHGGGWIVGSPLTHADISRGLCEASGLEVASVDYALAPEHPAPFPIDDGLAVVRHLLGEHGCKRKAGVILCGDSAGAAIALAIERAASAATRKQILGVCACYGCYGIMDDEAFRKWGSREQGLDKPCVARMWRLAHAAGGPSPYEVEALARPSAVPVYLLAGDNDSLVEDSRVLATALKNCGRCTTLDLVAGEMHGFLHGPDSSGTASAALSRICGWIDGICRD